MCSSFYVQASASAASAAFRPPSDEQREIMQHCDMAQTRANEFFGREVRAPLSPLGFSLFFLREGG